MCLCSWTRTWYYVTAYKRYNDRTHPIGHRKRSQVHIRRGMRIMFICHVPCSVHRMRCTSEYSIHMTRDRAVKRETREKNIQLTRSDGIIKSALLDEVRTSRLGSAVTLSARSDATPVCTVGRHVRQTSPPVRSFARGRTRFTTFQYVRVARQIAPRDTETGVRPARACDLRPKELLGACRDAIKEILARFGTQGLCRRVLCATPKHGCVVAVSDRNR